MKKESLLQKIHRWDEKQHKYINGTKGVVSLFLAILMVPFVMIAGSLINAARINSAVAVFDEALCNASNSTLGTYDSFLKKRFGLLAMSQDVSSSGEGLSGYTVSNLISETFNYYMEENLKVLSNTYISSESTSTGVYPLSNTDVLYTQILEYSKYTVPTKLVIDGLSLNDLLKKLEDSIPGKNVLEMITCGAGVANSIAVLANDFTLLKDAVTEQETSEGLYDAAFTAFSSAVTNYRSTKSEMDRQLKILDEKVKTERNKIIDIINRIEGLEQDIKTLQQEQSSSNKDNSEKIAELQKTLKEYRKEHEDDLKPWEDAKAEYAEKKTYYEDLLKEYYSDVSATKTEYSGAIKTLMGKLKTTKEKLTTVQTDILNLGSSITNMVTTGVEQSIKEAQKKNTETIAKNKELISTTTDPNEKARLEAENKALEEANHNLDNQQSVNDAQKKGYENATKSMKEKISSVNTEEYTEEYNALDKMKREKVDVYDTQNIPYVSTDTSKTHDYYLKLKEILTSSEVEQAEKDMVAECTKGAIWSLIQALFGFIEALFNAATVYDPNLKAVIDATYYNDTYGGLPSEKDRTTHPLSMGEAGDAALSQHYKDLMGDYSSGGGAGTGGMDVIAKLMSIFTNLGIISTNVTAIMSIVGLFDLGDRLKKIMDAAESIVENVKSLITYFANLFSESKIGGKMMLTGYVAYNTSNRVTYKGAALTGALFNMRAQQVPAGLKGSKINGFAALIDTIQQSVSGGTDKCFYGAETEYIIFGSKSELVNQTAAFAVTYGIRILANILPILSNTEVQSIAAATTIGAPIVNLLYMLIEPLVDTIILVNNGKLKLLKDFVYLTPSGIPKLITKFSSLKLSTEQLDQAKEDFKSSLGVSDVKGLGEMNVNDKSFLDYDYTQNLFLIMLLFTNSERMLERMSNIIQMEAVEYMINKGMGSNGKFDLDYSYTYIRTEASFTTNEFISVSDGSNGLSSTERIVYRGY